MIKIVHIARPVSGVGVYIELLLKHVNDKQFKNCIISNENENTVKFDTHVQKYHVNIIREIKLINDIRSLIRIIEILKENKPNIIHCHSAKAGILGRIAGAYLKIPVLYTPHAYSYLSAETKLKRFLFKSIEKAFRFLPSKTLACSKSEYDRSINDLRIKKENVYCWSNSIEDPIVFKPSKILEEVPSNFICSIGRPSYQKNMELLVKTIIELKKTEKNIHLVIVGVGRHSLALEAVNSLIKNNNLERNITLVPWIDREETMFILSKSKLYISTSKYEGLPYAVVEALALGKPCIVTEVDGNKDLIQNNYNGFLVKENTTAISRRIIELVINKDLETKMSTNARASFEQHYNINNNIKALEEVYLTQAKIY